MADFSKIARDSDACEWRDYAPGIRLKLRPNTNAKFVAMRDRLQRKGASRARKDPGFNVRCAQEAMAQHLVADWQGIELPADEIERMELDVPRTDGREEDGRTLYDVPCTPTNVFHVLRDRQYADFYEWAITETTDIGAQHDDTIADAVGN